MDTGRVTEVTIFEPGILDQVTNKSPNFPNTSAELMSAQERSFSFTRADGTIEVANSPEDAIKRCPVLGKIPVEQANVLLELASIGNQMMVSKDQDVKEKSNFLGELAHNKKDALPVEADVDRDVSEKKVIDNKTKDFQKTSNQPYEHELFVEPEITKPAVYVAAEHDMQKEVSYTPAIISSLQERYVLNEPVIPSTNMTSKIQRKEEYTVAASANTEIEDRHAEEGRFITKTLLPNTESVAVIIETSEQLDSGSDHMSPIALTALKATNQVETTAATNNDAITDEIVAETFEELFYILNDENKPDVNLPDIDSALNNERQVISVNLDTYITAEKNAFEDYLKIISQSEKTTHIVLSETTQQKPVEELLVRLIDVFEQKAIRETEEFKAAAQDLTNVIMLSNPNIFSGADIVHITPELTHKFLLLLQIAGYENPKKVLLDLVSRHDIEFLAQAIKYLAQISNPDNQQEFLRSKLVSHPMKNIVRPITQQIGGVVMLLMKAGHMSQHQVVTT